MSKLKSLEELFGGRHFDREIIILCVRWYLRYKLSLRDLVEMMAERGLSLAHTTILRWVRRYTPEFVKRWNRFATPAGRSWRVDESVSRTQARACGAVLKMGAGLPRPACWSRLQTARCCCVQKAWW
jgi:transposase-like protein